MGEDRTEYLSVMTASSDFYWLWILRHNFLDSWGKKRHEPSGNTRTYGITFNHRWAVQRFCNSPNHSDTTPPEPTSWKEKLLCVEWESSCLHVGFPLALFFFPVFGPTFCHEIFFVRGLNYEHLLAIVYKYLLASLRSTNTLSASLITRTNLRQSNYTPLTLRHY